MSLDLETVALIAAAVHKPLRARLDANDFHSSKASLVEAFKDGKRPENRQCVQRWLGSLGVDWDGKSDIGEAIIASLVDLKRRRRAQTALERAANKLRWPNLAGPQGIADATKLADIIQGIVSNEQRTNHREPGA